VARAFAKQNFFYYPRNLSSDGESVL